MSRDDGFSRADVDTGFLSDPKIVALARRQRDPVRTAATCALYLAVVLASWRAAERVPFDQASPAWFLDPDDVLRADLVGVGLLGDDGCVPAATFESWFRPAWDRREARRAAGRKGGQKGAQPKPSDSGVQAEVKPSLSATQPDRPSGLSVPTVPSDTPATARDLDPADPIFAYLEVSQGVSVDRGNGHARDIRNLVQAHGLAAVMASIRSITTPIASLRDAWLFATEDLAPRPPAKAARTAGQITPTTRYGDAERAADAAPVKHAAGDEPPWLRDGAVAEAST